MPSVRHDASTTSAGSAEATIRNHTSTVNSPPDIVTGAYSSPRNTPSPTSSGVASTAPGGPVTAANPTAPASTIATPPGSPDAAESESVPSVSGQYATGVRAVTARTSGDFSGVFPCCSRRRIPPPVRLVHRSPLMARPGFHDAASVVDRTDPSAVIRSGVFRPAAPNSGLVGLYGLASPSRLSSVSDAVDGGASCPSPGAPREMVIPSRVYAGAVFHWPP